MSNIVINQVSVETRVVEVPDYTPQRNLICELNELNRAAVLEKTRAIEVLKGSMVEQIGCYLYELVKPLFPAHIYVYTEVEYVSNHVALRFKLDGDKAELLVGDHPILLISIDNEGYHIYEGAIRYERDVVLVAKYWSKLRERLLRNIEQRVSEQLKVIENSIMQEEEERSLIENFKL